MFKLQQQAFNALRDCFSSKSELLRYKAAITIVEKVEAIPEGPVYVREIHQKQQPDQKLYELTICK